MIRFQRIIAGEGDEITACFRSDRNAVSVSEGEGILDVNADGNWVHGLELISGFVHFKLEKALAPFDPVPPLTFAPPSPAGTVTYDRDGDDEMGFLYLLYEDAFLALPENERARLLKVSCSIENPHCRFGLDSEGGLVHVVIPMADLATPPEIFLKLLKK